MQRLQRRAATTHYRIGHAQQLHKACLDLCRPAPNKSETYIRSHRIDNPV